MDSTDRIRTALATFSFGYPFVMAWYWMAGGLLYRWFRGRHEPAPGDVPVLAEYPMVSILVPCYNEQDQAEETFAALAHIEYPAYEILAINDGSRDGTAKVLDELAARIPQLRVVQLKQNQGKARALNGGAMLARGELLVCIDGDALLDRSAVTWFVRRMLSDGRLGGITGNPRLRNRSSLLGQLQVGEFSSIVGLIKRSQTVLGWLFTVSGVICCFRKRALQEAGWWSAETLTDDVDLTWRLQISGWHVAFEAKAMCWILMPETLRGLWHQRLRWSEGGTHAVLISARKLFGAGRSRVFCVWSNYWLSVFWAYLTIAGILASLLQKVGVHTPRFLPVLGVMPEWTGVLLALTYLAQAVVSVGLDRRFERHLVRALFWVVWYPLVFWFLQMATAIAGLPMAIWRIHHPKGTWTSPDRGVA